MKKILLALLLSAVPAQAAILPRGSLFFSGDRAATADSLAERALPPGVGDIKLGAIIFYAPGDWVLWIRGQKWTPQTRGDDLRVIGVTPERAELEWRDDDDGSLHDITLQPSESYQISTGRIIPTP